MRSVVPTRVRRSGFTLVEILLVLTIMGLLSAIAIPKYGHAKGRGTLGVIQSDLRNLATAEEAYLFDHGTYAPTPADLAYAPSRGVTLTITEATRSGWSAEASHPTVAPLRCALYVGTVPPPPQTAAEGIIDCR